MVKRPGSKKGPPKRSSFSEKVRRGLIGAGKPKIAGSIPKLPEEVVRKNLEDSSVGFLTKAREAEFTKLHGTLDRIYAKDLEPFKQELARRGLSEADFQAARKKLAALQKLGLHIRKLPDGTCEFTESVVKVISFHPELHGDIEFVYRRVIEPINQVIRPRI